MKAGIYCRVSSESQATNGVSLQAQQERLEAFCVAKTWDVHRVYVDDGYSAATLDRPAIQELLRDVKARRVGVIVVYRLDRLTRRLSDLESVLKVLEKYEATLASLSESLDASSASGRLMLNLLMSVAAWEREIIGERTAAALQYKKMHLSAYGTVPFGFLREGDTLKPCEKELRTVKRIYQLRERGKTLREICDALQASGTRTKTGKRFQPETVRLILGNSIYLPYVSGGAS